MAPRTFSIISPLLVLLLLVLPVAQAGCSKESGSILVPTLTQGPPLHSNPSLMQGVTVWKIGVAHNAFERDPFLLAAAPGSSSVRGCHVQLCTEVPDFNVAWYAAGDHYITQHDEPGKDEGIVPDNALYALVYMRYGPDPGTGDGSIAGSFVLYLGC